MGFTKAQRLKGLKKQLGNLGYDVVSRGGTAPEADREEPATPDGERGVHTLASMKAREESW